VTLLPDFDRFCQGEERQDLSELAQRLRHDYQPWLESLSSKERRCLGIYKDMSYRDINTFMRTGDVKGASDEFLEDIDDTAKVIEQALMRARLPFSTTVYRGLKRGYPPEALQVGHYLSEIAFTSTTLSAQFARQISLWDADSISSTILEISVPEGIAGAFIEPLWDKGEHELLLLAPLLIHVSGIRMNADEPTRRYVQCQCVQI
jgi:hypothetical protein